METKEEPNVVKKVDYVLAETWHTFAYELSNNFEALKNKSTWLYFFAALALVAVLIKKPVIAIISIITLIALKFKFDHDSGEVTAFIRKKKGIPSKSEIRKMKENANVTKQ